MVSNVDLVIPVSLPPLDYVVDLAGRGEEDGGGGEGGVPRPPRSGGSIIVQGGADPVAAATARTRYCGGRSRQR